SCLALLSFLCLLTASPNAAAQCSGSGATEAVWQTGRAILSRCGRPGFLTNDIYYSAQEVKTWQWRSLYGYGTATYYTRNYITYTGGNANLDPDCSTDLCGSVESG